MKLPIAGVLGDAWTLARRDAGLLVPVAGLLSFVPQAAVLLLVPLPPPLTAAGAGKGLGELLPAYLAWSGGNAGWWLLLFAVQVWAAIALNSLYLDRRAPDVGGALRRGAALWPRAVLATMLLQLPIGLGLYLILPGLYVMGRTTLTYPRLAGGGPRGALAAIGDSVSLTRGNGWRLAGVLAVGYCLPQVIGAALIVTLDGTAGTAARAATGCLAAAVLAAGGLAQVLIQVSAMRRLARG